MVTLQARVFSVHGLVRTCSGWTVLSSNSLVGGNRMKCQYQKIVNGPDLAGPS